MQDRKKNQAPKQNYLNFLLFEKQIWVIKQTMGCARQHPSVSRTRRHAKITPVGVWSQRMLRTEVQQWWKPQLRGNRGCSASHLVPHQEELSQHIL